MTLRGAIPPVLKTADRLFHICTKTQYCKVLRSVFSFLLLVRRLDDRGLDLHV